MIRRVRGFDDFTLYYDCESEKCVITINDAIHVSKEDLEHIANLCETYRLDIDIVGRYIDAGEKWDRITDKELRFISDSEITSDWVRQHAEKELRSRVQQRMGYVYLLQADNGLYKIGQSKVVDNRIKQLGLTLPYELNLISTISSVRYKELESYLHEKFADKRVRGEWFELDENDVAHLIELGMPNERETEDKAFG